MKITTRLTNFIPCLLFAGGTFLLIIHGYTAVMVFLGGLGTFLVGAAAMSED